MASPGRTHISWQTQDGQVQELISYIGYLEAKLQYLQLHHAQCDIYSIPPEMITELSHLPPDFVLPPGLMGASDSPVSQADTIVCMDVDADIEVEPPAPEVPKKKIAALPRWSRIIDQMTKGWDRPSSWVDKRIAIGLDSVETNHLALGMLLGSPPVPTSRTRNPPSILNAAQFDQTIASSLLASAKRYALGTTSSDRKAGFAIQLHNFRELIFASLCVVLEHQGLAIDDINDLMRMCMSSSGAANLYRLRRGALWVNRVIAGLMRRGWKYGATEFFLLSGRPISQYGLLWEACAHSFPCLSERLGRVYEDVKVPVNEDGWIPVCIPSVIKGVVGDALTLGQICTALDYEEQSLSGLFGQEDMAR